MAEDRWPDQDQIGSFLQPAISGTQGRDVGFGDHRHGIEVEVLQRLAGEQLRLAQVSLDATPITLGDFVLCQCHQQPGRRPAFLVRALGELRQTCLIAGKRNSFNNRPRRVRSIFSFMPLLLPDPQPGSRRRSRAPGARTLPASSPDPVQTLRVTPACLGFPGASAAQ